MKKVIVFDYAGEFGENKDQAQKVREVILRELERGKEIKLDFEGVTGVTQSFVHAMVAEPIKKYPEKFFDLVAFSNCTDLVRTVVELVIEYMQES